MSKIPILYTLGLNSNTEDNKHIIMLDFDIDDISTVKDEIKNAIEKFKLSSFYIIKSTHGFNAFCLDKVNLNCLFLILNDFENIDKDFIFMTGKRGYATIRIGKDKKYIMKIESNYNDTIKSKPHKNALKYYYDITINDTINFDNYKIASLCQYENKKYGQKLPYNNIQLKKYIR